MQDVNSNLQNSSAVLKSDVKNFIQDRMYQVTSTEAKSGVDLQGDGKVDTASGNSVKNDHNFTSIVLPLSASMHGNPIFPAINTFTALYLVYF